MAIKTKSKKQAEEVEEEVEETEEAEEEEEEAPPAKAKKIDVGGLKTLMEKYEVKDAKLQAAKAAVESSMKSRSITVKKIAELIAPETRFKYKGKEMSISHRGDSYFFRGPRTSPAGLTEID